MLIPSFRSSVALGAMIGLPLLFSPSVQADEAPAKLPAWVSRSNENAMILGHVLARFEPESAHELGVMTGFDDQVRDLGSDVEIRYRKALDATVRTLNARLETEGDVHVREDLGILIAVAERRVRESEAREKSEVPYYDAAQIILSGVDTLLGATQSDGTSTLVEPRRQAALIRLRRYAGLEEKGPAPLAVLAEQRARERFDQAGIAGPYKARLERDLASDGEIFNGVRELLKQHSVQGTEPILAKLDAQLAHYAEFVRKEMLPRARADFRLPRERYLAALESTGVDVAPEELIALAHAGFEKANTAIKPVARDVAVQYGLPPETDWREVIRLLKQKEALNGPEETLAHYRARAEEIGIILRRENLVALPEEPLRIRLATPAENTSVPAPFFNPTPLLNNLHPGDPGEFVLVTGPGASGSNPTVRYDDFTYKAASFWVCSHEGRPGHELQFGAMQRNGVSLARSVYAFNSVNVEGWAVYCEALMLPYMPKENQLVALQFRMARAAYAFLDAELQLDRTTPEEAKRVLTKEVGISDAYTASLLRRFTYLAPSQATSYFYGYTRMMELREETEAALGTKFQAKKFHDFVLSQGLLPPAQLGRAVKTALLER